MKHDQIIRAKRGAALMEFVMCLPVLLVITLGTLETCRMIYLRQSLKLAAYECARLAIVPGVDSQMVQDQCDVFLLGRGIRGYTFTCTPADPKDAIYGELVTTNVSMKAESNAIVGAWFYRGKTLSESVSIMAEY
ncbi:TadE/TadG family type IV pilus assembly protein [Rhodopirellula baltica]|uniref:TadE-like protein n=1 Tax=Rhodopirellula baltica SWK14 TaxID=993516 RepID=L7CHL3_RHOBT|nr:TadE family protein [Rhodopirellula baltica]ELP33117.1 TadE-like protein [Rhodopirellula baltica SWK14]